MAALVTGSSSHSPTSPIQYVGGEISIDVVTSSNPGLVPAASAPNGYVLTKSGSTAVWAESTGGGGGSLSSSNSYFPGGW